jgi:hypothetical protein
MPREPREIHDEELQIELLTIGKAVYKYFSAHPLANDYENKYCALWFAARDPAPGRPGVYAFIVRDTELDPQDTKHKLIMRFNYMPAPQTNKDVSLSIEYNPPHKITFYSQEDDILATGSEEQLIKIAKELIKDFEAVCLERGGYHRGRVSSLFGHIPVADKVEYILHGLESMERETLTTSVKHFFGEDIGAPPLQVAAPEQGGEQP